MDCKQYFWLGKPPLMLSGFHLNIKIKDSVIIKQANLSPFQIDKPQKLLVKMGQSYGDSEIVRVKNTLAFMKAIFD